MSSTNPHLTSDSDPASAAAANRPNSALEDSIFKSYLQLAGHSSPDLSKIQSFRALSCLICLERIRISDPTWSCSASCFAVFHLFCIQSWARQASDLAAERAVARLSRDHFPAAAAKALDAAPSAGSPCFCEKVEDVRRCGFKNFSCNGVCAKLLDCKIHRCVETCHEGPCPPCHAKGVYRCECGKTEMEMECFKRKFRCESACEKLRGCHAGSCGECPLQGKRTCPCGKRKYEGMACDVLAPTCGLTCDKTLSCGFHRCPERCHRGLCLETCTTVVLKSCRCGSLKKEVPCSQALVCERKCQQGRDCGRHACRRRCCDGDCPPCSEICGRKLRCNNHKCQSPCHRGACAPCPLMVTISCACGETRFEVPCGTEADQKPPRCRKPCGIAPLCRHASIRKPHKCHYGACPACRLICDEEFPCGHKCKLRCHGPIPPPNPEFTLKPKKKRMKQQTECTPGSPCPPCSELVWRSCLGQHIGAERMMVCSDRSVFSCENLCGSLLPCGNHYCTKICHALKNKTLTSGLHVRSESCEDCELPCQKERKLQCPHPCPLPCHPGECPQCKVLIKRSCHCGSMVHVFDCTYYNSLSEKEQLAIRSCRGPCHRKLPNCYHLCPETCHPGPCSSPERCSKKVNVRCACQNLKKEWICQDVQTAYRKSGRDPKDISKSQIGIGLIPCNPDCAKKLKPVESELQSRKAKSLENKEPIDTKPVSKRKKRRERLQETEQTSMIQAIGATLRRCLIVTVILIGVVATMYFGYKGLLLLNDWMNEIEEKRQSRRFPRI